MPDETNTQVDSELEVNPKGGEEVNENSQESNSDLDKSRPNITPEVLQGSQDALKRWLKEDIQKNVGSVREDIQKLVEQQEALASSVQGRVPDSEDGEEAPALDLPELIDLRKKNAELDDAVSKLRANLEDAQTKERDYRFETTVKDALTRAGCTKTDIAYRVIGPELSMDEDDRRVFATVEGEYGTEELGIKDYIDRVAKESMIPELFQGNTRPGSPSGGDDGEGSSAYVFTREQISDPEFYQENREKIRSALEKGLVKGF